MCVCVCVGGGGGEQEKEKNRKEIGERGVCITGTYAHEIFTPSPIPNKIPG